MKLSRTVMFMMATAAATFTSVKAETPAETLDQSVTPISEVSIVFNDGATNITNLTLTLNADGEAALPSYADAAAKKSGWTFWGWSDKDGGAFLWKDGSTVKFDKDATLYAKYAKNKYTVKFNKNKGKGKMKAQKKMNYVKGTKLSANKFTKKGYSFSGWATTKKGTPVYKNKAKVKIPTNGKATLYAGWAKTNYKVKFYGNGATSGSMKTQKMTYGKKAKLAKNKFARTGYTFEGWAKTADATTATYKNQKKVKNLLKTGKTAKLYAVWKQVDTTATTTK